MVIAAEQAAMSLEADEFFLINKRRLYHPVAYYDFDDYAIKLMELLETFKPDVVVLAAAVSDYAPVKTTGKTGVEMEALTAVAVAALTVYDMAKAAEKTMKIQNIRLVEKHGGRSGDVVNE